MTAPRIAWIGERRLVPALHDRPESVFPIRIRAGAFAPDVPRRDLLLSPGQVIVFDGCRIRAGALINGATILREDATRSARYVQIELDRRADVVADGLICESYVDVGDRGFFADARGISIGRPRARELARHERGHRPDMAHVDRILLDRATALGMVVPVEVDIRLVVDGVMLRPDWVDVGAYGFWLKQPSSNVRLVATPGKGMASDDGRELAVSRISHRSFDVTAAPVILVPDARWVWVGGAAQLPGFGAGELVIETARQRTSLWMPSVGVTLV